MSDLLSDALKLSSGRYSPERSRVLPDIAEDSIATIARRLDRVGMSGIELALLRRGDDGALARVPAKAEATVSLDEPSVKGIHMSRLFLRLQEELDGREFGPAAVESVLGGFVASHRDLSSSAQLAIDFDHLTRRPSLLSGLAGWRTYPVRVRASGNAGETSHSLRVRLTYSSTCPCSAALSRQLIQEGFRDRFGLRNDLTADEVANWLGTQQAIAALPHSQRSHADVTIRLAAGLAEYPVDELVGRCERALGTPVQTAVKRADEQEFARLNAEQLMFVEDAARQLAQALDDFAAAADYHVRVRHLESLHPHDAVATVVKGLAGGFTP